jgi:hypothetical protein
VVIEDPPANGNLPVGVGITQKHLSADQRQRVDANSEPEPCRDVGKAEGFLLLDRSGFSAHAKLPA